MKFHRLNNILAFNQNNFFKFSFLIFFVDEQTRENTDIMTAMIYDSQRFCILIHSQLTTLQKQQKLKRKLVVLQFWRSFYSQLTNSSFLRSFFFISSFCYFQNPNKFVLWNENFHVILHITISGLTKEKQSVFLIKI